jgi:P4 family phage/plasmid primase-like protien
MSTRMKNAASSQLQSFLSNYRTERGCEFTHTSLSRPVGSFFIPVDTLNTFYNLYMEAFETDADLHITEKHRHISPFLIDFDFRFEMSDGDDVQRRYTAIDVDNIIKLYAKHIVDLVDVPQDTFEVYVLEKPLPTIQNGLLKDGIHIIIPSIVTRPSVQHLIRRKVLESISDVWGHLNLSNDFGNVVDEAVIERNNWLMYGSKKVGGECYKITRVVEYNITDGSITDKEKNKEESEYVEILSIRNKYVETEIKIEKIQEIDHFEKLLENKRQRMVASRNIITDEETTQTNTYDNIDLVRKLIAILDGKRCDDYHQWIRLGWCLRNIDHRLLAEWDEFSKKSQKYKIGECEFLWNHMRIGGLGIGTLHMWSKDDNPESYKDIIRHDLKTMIERSYKYGPTHHDIAKVIFEMYKHEFVCASIKSRAWYEFRNHRWHNTDSGHSLRMRISTDVFQEYINESVRLQRMLGTIAGEKELKETSEYVKKCLEIAMKLKQTSYKDNLMRECAELFYVEKFEERLDSNTNLIGFENGVYDLDILEFREGHPEDYISFATGINYVEFKPNHPHVQSVFRYLEQVLPKQHIREYVMKLFASFLNGAIKEQKFHIWTGSGSNSKSKLVELFEKCFGDYCCKFPVTMLTQKRIASNAANTELARAKGKRFACLQEPSEDEKISVGQLKEYSGGDKIIARCIYKEPVEFVPQFKMLLLCNHLPHVPSDDGGTWRRIRVVEFTSKFVDDPCEENEFPIDLELSSKMEDWKEHFMALLIDTYKRYLKEGIKEPDEVTQCTRDYKRQNDHLADFIHNCVESSEGSFMLMNEAFNELKAWIKDDNIPMKPSTKPELEKYLSKNLVKTTTMGTGMKGFRGFKLKNRNAAFDRDAIDS